MEMFHVKHDERSMELTRQHEGDDVQAAKLDPLVRNRLLQFKTLLMQWNSTIKLVSAQDIAHLWSRHIEDALQLLPLLPPGNDHAIDMGSGGGFPGLVLALATGIHFDLVESDSRKAAFLREATTVTQAAATIHACRVEDATLQPRMMITARALAPLPRLLELCHPLLAEGGVCLFPKGERADAEITQASRTWLMDLERIPSLTSPTGLILRIKNLRRRGMASA